MRCRPETTVSCGPPYWAIVDLLDVQIGRLLDELARLKLADNTLVIYHSDHGKMLGDHGIYTKGPFLYDTMVHVPLIIRLPGPVNAGTVINSLVELTDIAPTILDAVGIDKNLVCKGGASGGCYSGSATVDPLPERPPGLHGLLQTGSRPAAEGAVRFSRAVGDLLGA